VIAGGVPAWELGAEQERAILETNLGGVLNAARAGVPALLRRPQPREGRFIAVASTAATRGLPNLAAYCASKAGVTGFVKALAVELGGTGVTANTVSPGSTRSAILDESARLYGLHEAEAFADQQPVKRLLEPEEIAGLIAWLASPSSAGATGGDYPLDGGLSL
jgi:NAD(P)-dependent dehydrogenase (short-subunit alcohol dehydrogenase family)